MEKRVSARTRWSAAAALLAVLTCPSWPQSSLESLVTAAMAQNPGLKAQRARVAAAEQVPTQAKALPDPVADVELMNISTSHPNLSDSLTMGSSVGVMQTLPFPGKRGLAAAVAEREADMERAKLAVMEARLRADVLSAAYRQILYNKLLDLNDRAGEALEVAAGSATAVYASGMGTQVDALQAQTALTKVLAEREELVHQSDITRARLRSLLGVEGFEDVTVNMDLPETQSLPPMEELEKTLPGFAPAVLEAKTGEALGQAKVDKARRDFKPDFILGARYRFNDPTMGGGDFVSLQAGITLPFFHRKDRYKPALEESLDRLASTRYEAEEALNGARYDLSEAYHTAFMAQRISTIYEKGLLLQARQVYESALSSYSAGKVDFSTVITALDDYFNYQADALRARSDFQEALLRMESALGYTLPSNGHPSPATQTPNPSGQKESKP